MTEEERAWERTRAAILRRNADPTLENFEAASRRVDELVEAMERPSRIQAVRVGEPKQRRPKAA